MKFMTKSILDAISLRLCPKLGVDNDIIVIWTYNGVIPTEDLACDILNSSIPVCYALILTLFSSVRTEQVGHGLD